MTIRISIGLFLVTCLLYGQVVNHDFVNFDTHYYLLHNPHIQDGLNTGTLSWAFTTFYFSNWHPVTWLSYLVEIRLFGFNPAVFHLTNLLIHAANVVLLFVLLGRMTGMIWPAALTALLFAVHPAQVESVAWVAERKDVLSLFFMLCTLFAFHQFVRNQSYLTYGIALVCYALGLMSKPMILTLPFVLLLFDYWPYGRMALSIADVRDKVIEKLPFFVMSGLSAWLTLLAQGDGGAIVTDEVLSVDERLVNALVAYGYYIKTALLPANLAVFYPHPGYWMWYEMLASLVLLVSMAGLAIWFSKQQPWVTVGLLIFLGTLVPVIGLVQVGAQAYADRYTYIPYIGLFIAVSYSAAVLIDRYAYYAKYIKGGLAVMCLVYSVVTVQYVSHWKNSTSLWTHTLLATDELFAMLIGLEDPRTTGRRPAGLFKGYYSLGTIKFDAQQYEESEQLFAEAVKLVPSSTSAWFYYGVSLSEVGNIELAETVFERIIESQPGNEKIRREIALQMARVKGVE